MIAVKIGCERIATYEMQLGFYFMDLSFKQWFCHDKSEGFNPEYIKETAKHYLLYLWFSNNTTDDDRMGAVNTWQSRECILEVEKHPELKYGAGTPPKYFIDLYGGLWKNTVEITAVDLFKMFNDIINNKCAVPDLFREPLSQINEYLVPIQ